MKAYILIIAMAVTGCGSGEEVSVRKLPCENVFTYNNVGTLDGSYLTVYYAVEYFDSIPFNTIRSSADTIFKKVDMTKYSGFVCWFLKESSALREIKNCETKDGHNIPSNQNQVLAVFSYNSKTNSLDEINYGMEGGLRVNPSKYENVDSP